MTASRFGRGRADRAWDVGGGAETGSIFPEIADVALRPAAEGPCSRCGRAGLRRYPYVGKVVRYPAGRSSEDPHVTALCAPCVLRGDVERRVPPELREAVTRYAADPEEALRVLHRLPDVPLFMQDFDGPLCCGAFSEFVGSPATDFELLEAQRTCAPWQYGQDGYARDFAAHGMPESLDEISVFACRSCGRRHLVDQFS